MTMTNYGNGYKFSTIIKKRSNPQFVMVQRMKKDGTWGKATKSPVFGKETPEQVIERLIANNNVQFRIAE